MFDWVTFISSLGASGIVSVATAGALTRYLGDRWMLQLKARLDKELEDHRSLLERERKIAEAKVGHRIYVTKTQFDAEFNALKDCFFALGKVRLAFNGLRPTIDFLPQDESEKVDRIKERLENFTGRYETFVDVAQSIYPFVPVDIHEQFQICMKAALLEIRTIQQDVDRALTPQGYLKGGEYRERFEAAYHNAATLVRERLRQLSVVPG